MEMTVLIKHTHRLMVHDQESTKSQKISYSHDIRHKLFHLYVREINGACEPRIVFKKDNQRCGAILQHEMKKIAVLIFAPPRGYLYTVLQYV